jgi:hypothetical protein
MNIHVKLVFGKGILLDANPTPEWVVSVKLALRKRMPHYYFDQNTSLISGLLI